MPGTRHPIKSFLELDPESNMVHRVAVHDLDGHKVRKVGPGRPLDEFPADAKIVGAERRSKVDMIDPTRARIDTGDLEELLQKQDSLEDVKSLFARDGRKTAYPVYSAEIERRQEEGDAPAGNVVRESVSEEVQVEDAS